MKPENPAILFVCLGNICRSPLAEAAFRAAATAAGLAHHTDSAGTAAYHVGDPPDSRSVTVAASYGIDISSYRGRQICAQDYRSFTHILALDRANLADIRRHAPADSTAKIALLLDMADGNEDGEVADPYYGDLADFETTWSAVRRAADALVAKLLVGRT